MSSQKPDDLMQTLAHHDAAISTLGGRMTGVERGMATLQTEVHTGFNALNVTLNGLNSKIDRFDSRPQFDLHKNVRTVVSLAALFSMVVAGIIWVTTNQFAPLVQIVQRHEQIIAKSEQDGAEIKGSIAEIKEKLGWIARIDTPKGAR